MDISIAMTQLAAAVEQQVVIAGGDPQAEDVARAIVAAIEPTVRQIAFSFAEQAAAEVAAQLPGHEIDVVVEGGDPGFRVRQGSEETTLVSESLDARITLRLPPRLKEIVESAADERGESVNTWLVKALSSRAEAGRKQRGRKITGTIET